MRLEEFTRVIGSMTNAMEKGTRGSAMATSILESMTKAPLVAKVSTHGSQEIPTTANGSMESSMDTVSGRVPLAIATSDNGSRIKHMVTGSTSGLTVTNMKVNGSFA